MFFGIKKKSLTTSEETLLVSEKIASGIEKLHITMENLIESVSSHMNRIEVYATGYI